MKLLITVVHSRDKARLTQELLASGYRFTEVASTGGLLREGNTTLLIGVEDEELSSVLSIIEKNCKSREQFINPRPLPLSEAGPFPFPTPLKVRVGGAIVFVVEVAQFYRY
ncbi:cyclic-di-AMP receptor [bacterium]|nr:cyclic-di-AMP receptor [bacterium]